jgi:hypothetical protein
MDKEQLLAELIKRHRRSPGETTLLFARGDNLQQELSARSRDEIAEIISQGQGETAGALFPYSRGLSLAIAADGSGTRGLEISDGGSYRPLSEDDYWNLDPVRGLLDGLQL